MDQKLTREQEKQLVSWVSERDLILLDIANKKTESEKLTITNKNLASSNTEIADRIQQSLGRLEELEKKEKERALLVIAEIAGLSAEKSTLQTQISELKKEILSLKENKNLLTEDIIILTKVQETLSIRANQIEKVITETVTINSSNAREIKNILVEAGIELKKMIDIGSENVAVTNKLVAEIPKIIVDIHRDVLERKKINKHKI